MREFLKLLSKRVFRLQFEGTDFVSTIFTAVLGAADHFYPNWGIDMEVISWQTPLFLLGLAFLLRLISAPYYLWKEQKEKYEALQIRNGQAVVSESYGKYVSRIYADLIDDWRPDGITLHARPLGMFVPPKSFKCWHILEDLSIDLNQPEELRKDIKKFLGYFLTYESALQGLFASCYIKTAFQTEEEMQKAKPEIKALALSLSERLKNVRRQE